MKSSLIIILGACVSTIFFPYLLNIIGIDFKVGVMLGSTFILSFVLAYVRCFIESKKGFTKSFYITYLIFAVAFGVISFFWMFLNTYV
ncbi:hypothetical protein [uncultured Clostridium sp.]|uniref:hypothetical protein n=1 Tax=uncultured Clostridium sp. TaxID=59620 RepID=UPI002606AE46|nr:hypothetical protein [uncultured Clostridium sp.]